MSGNRDLAERFIESLEARDRAGWAAPPHPGVACEIPLNSVSKLDRKQPRD